MEHDVGHGNEDHRLAAFDQGLVVFGQSAVLAEPGERALHDPPLGQHDEAAARVTLDNLDEPTVPPANPMRELPSVSAVGKDQLQSAKTCAQLLNEQAATVAVLDIRRMHDEGDDQPKRIDDHMPLAPTYLLARVVPTVPPFSAVLTDWLSIMPTLGVGFLPTFFRTRARSRS